MPYDISQNEIEITANGNTVTIEYDQFKSLKSVEQVSCLGDELRYDTLEVKANQKRTFSNNGASYGSDLQEFPYGSSAQFTNAVYNRFFYIEESKQIGTYLFDYACVSIIGILDRQYFTGGLYLRAYFRTVLKQIIGNSGDLITYSIANDLQTIPINGWIPYGTKREALQQLLFAASAHMYVDSATGNVTFDYLDSSVITPIADADIFDTGKVEYPQLATKVTVLEHSFFDNDFNNNPIVTLFDNTSSDIVSSHLVVFPSAPIIMSTIYAEGDLTFTGTTENTAVVSGRGVLKGKPYIHSTHTLVREDNAAGRKEYEVSVTNAYLVSLLNGENIADKMADFWFNRYIVKNDIKIGSQACGHLFSFKDAFKQTKQGFLQQMQKTYSSFIKAQCEFVCGLAKAIKGNCYNYGFIISLNNAPNYTGKFIPPTGATRIRVVLIGGGSSGTSGLAGKAGSTSGDGGEGGKGGTPGRGGNIYEFTIDNPGSSYDFSLGTGGVRSGATWNDTTPLAGHDGTESTFTETSVPGNTWSSGLGVPSETGWCEPYSGNSCARRGYDGLAGGKGGSAGKPSDAEADTSSRKGEDGEKVSYDGVDYAGGSGGSGLFHTAPTSFAIVAAMTDAQIVSAGVYVRQNGQTSLVTPSTPFAQAMISAASGGIQYCNALNWKNQLGIPGGGGGGAAYKTAGSAGSAGVCLASYPTCLIIDQENMLREGDSYCWHELNTTCGGNGGAGANSGYMLNAPMNVGDGGAGGCGGGGGGGAAGTPTNSKNIAWLLSEHLASPTAPTGGSAGYGGSSRDGASGAIIIYCEKQITSSNLIAD